MSAMSELSAEREEELQKAHTAYQEAFAEYMALIEKYPIAHRTLGQFDEVSKAGNRCTVASMKWEIAKSERYKVTA